MELVSGISSTRARNKLLNRIAIPTLYQNDRGKGLYLLLILPFIPYVLRLHSMDDRRCPILLRGGRAKTR